MKPSINNLSIFIPSCDKYSDTWDPFFDIFFQKWGNCPYNIYLGNNTRTFIHERVFTINVGEDTGWGDSIIKMLKAIPTDYVLMIFDDLYIINSVKQERIEHLFDLMRMSNGDCLRLNTAPRPSIRYKKSKEIGRIRKYDPYCISAQVAIWKKDTLLDLIKPEYTPWDFEFKGSKDECKKEHLLLGVFEAAIITLNMIEKGKWQRSSIEYLEYNGITIDTSKRGVMNNLIFPRGIERALNIYPGSESKMHAVMRNTIWGIRFNVIARFRNIIYNG